MADRLSDAGAQLPKAPKYAPIFVAASLTGLYSQRNVFHDPSNVVTQRFYGGRPDALYNGLNVELTNDLTIARRPGNTALTANYTHVPLDAFQWETDSGEILVMIDTAGFLYQEPFTGAAATLIFTKSAAAGRGYFVASGNVLYYGDGVDLIKYTPGNPNGLVWNWGIAAPTIAPTVTPIASGAAAVAWAASTVFSTMGFLVDPNSNVQQLYSVNANPANVNATQIGLSGNGAPLFTLTTGGTTSDGGVTWTCQGQIIAWTANTLMPSGQPIYDPTTNCIFVESHSTSRMTGSTRPAFNQTLGLSGARIDDTATSNNARWECLGQVNVSPTAVKTWTKNTAFNQYTQPSGGTDPSNVNSAIVFPLIPSATVLAGTQPTYLLGATTAGTTANTNYTPWTGVTSQTAGQITSPDGQLAWLCLGPAAWVASTQYFSWTYGTALFSAIKDSNGNMQVCTVAGQSGSGAAPTWQTAYGAITQDNTVSWTCVGNAMSWAAATNWFLPAAGFAPPLANQPYGGAQVIGSAFVQSVIASGLSGGSAPSWSVTVGTTTTDNGITWRTASAYSARSITWTASHVYAFSYKCREATDPYVTTSLLTFGSLNTQQAVNILGNIPGLVSPIGAYLGGGTGAISTSSPVFTLSSPNTAGAVNLVQGLGSTDPQVDTIVIWRDADGGGSSNMFELVEIPAPKPIAGVAQPWNFNDYLPDIPATVSGINFPGLDILAPAPIDDVNNPPPAGFLPLCDQLHFSRIWGAVGNTVFFSGGPDVGVGNPNEAFNPADDFPFKSTVIACMHSPAGLICPTTTDFECIYGGPSTSSFFSQNMLKGIGLANYSAWDRIGGEIYFLSPDMQFWSLNPAVQLARVGFPIANLLSDMAIFGTPGLATVTAYENGTDNAIFVGDGNEGWFRYNPHQVGADISGENAACWSPQAEIAGGCQMLKAVVLPPLAPGDPLLQSLIIGSNTTGKPILGRNQSASNSYSDNGTAYHAWFDIGAITMVFPGQRAAVKFLEFDFMPVGTQPTVSYAFDDPTPVPTWTAFTTFVYDPPIVYGGTAITPPYWPDRFYLSQNADVAVGRRIRIKVDYGSSDTVQNELISFAIFGRKYQEG
jgi:hypothetical protein